MSTISASTTTTTAYVVTADTTGTLVLQTGATPTTALTIDTSQNVGIGTSSPADKLDVTRVSSSNSTGGLSLTNSDASGYGSSVSWRLKLDGTNISTVSRIYAEAANATATFMPFQTTVGSTLAERMRIDLNGVLLVNTTARANAPDHTSIKLAVAGEAHLQSQGAHIWFGDSTNASPLGIGEGLVNTFGTDQDFLSIYYRASCRFFTGTTESARFDSSGNLSLGTTSVSGGRLTVKAATSSGANAMQVKDSADTVRMELSDNGYIRFPTVYGTFTVAAAANVYMYTDGGLYRSTSSLKYKKNVADATHGLIDLLKLRPVTYESKSKIDFGKTFGGFIAEEVHDAGLTEFVQYAEDGSPDALAYGNMVSICIKAIQELKAELDTVKAELAALRG